MALAPLNLRHELGVALIDIEMDHRRVLLFPGLASAPSGRRQLNCRREGSVRHASAAPEARPEQKAGHVEEGEQDARQED